MVVDGAGATVTARTHRRLLHVTAQPVAGGAIVLNAPDAPALRVEAPGRGADTSLTMSRIDSAAGAGAAADAWLSRHLGEDVRLVWLDDPHRRPVGEQHGGAPGDPVSFADTGPIHLTTEESLARLNEWLAAAGLERGEPSPGPLPMGRFRANIVVSGSAEPFAEDEWKLLRVGDVEMRFAEHCDRCVLPTIDPVTLAGSHEPTRTLALRRHWDQAVFFGIRLIPLTTGVVRVGDEVTVR